MTTIGKEQRKCKKSSTQSSIPGKLNYLESAPTTCSMSKPVKLREEGTNIDM